MATQVFQGIPGASYQTRGRIFTADANGVITVSNPTGTEVLDLINSQAVTYGGNPLVNFRNMVDGGDFSINPMQRNIAGIATTNAVATTSFTGPVYFADRFFAYSTGSPSVTQTWTADTSVAGFSGSMKIQRTATNASVTPIYFGHVMETMDSIRTQTQQVSLSFWARAGANFSAASSTLAVQLHCGTGSNQSAANLIAGSWTNQAKIIDTTQALTTTMTRYQFTGTVPGTATQLGILLSFTPVGTAGTDDSFVINGIQLETGATASAFEHRDAQVELEICQRYCWVVAEPAAGVVVGVGGAAAAANNQIFYMATPVQLYKAPTVTVAAGSFKVTAGAAAAAATGFAAGTTHIQNAISVVSTLTQAAGGSATLQGGGGSGYIMASADF